MLDDKHFISRYIQFIVERAEKNGLNHSQLARKVFLTVKDPPSTWRKIRSGTQELKFCEAVLLANEIGLDIASVSLEVRELMTLEVRSEVPHRLPLGLVTALPKLLNYPLKLIHGGLIEKNHPFHKI